MPNWIHNFLSLDGPPDKCKEFWDAFTPQGELDLSLMVTAQSLDDKRRLWGTSWNASECYFAEKTLCFDTGWASPKNAILYASNRFKALVITLDWVHEWYETAGSLTCHNGVLISESREDSVCLRFGFSKHIDRIAREYMPSDYGEWIDDQIEEHPAIAKYREGLPLNQ